jgi:hypothetical protein
MAFVCRAGATALMKYATSGTPHLYVILTNPFDDPPNTIWINVTTPNKKSDRSIILTRGDHPFLTHDSVLSYRFCDIVPLSKFAVLESEKKLIPSTDISPELLKKIQRAVSDSRLVRMQVRLKLHDFAAKNPELLKP